MDWIQCPLSAYVQKRVYSPWRSVGTTAFKRLAASTLLLRILKKCAKILGQGGILKLDLTRGVTAVLVTLHLAGCVLTLSEVQRLPFKGIIFRHRTSVFHTLVCRWRKKAREQWCAFPRWQIRTLWPFSVQ